VTDTTVATLKLVVVDPRGRAAAAAVEHQLVRLAGEGEVRRVGNVAFVVHTVLGTADVRDRLRGYLAEGDAAIVVEFETWSGYGSGIDTVWLMRRGH
jgi:hypothetical protein